MAIAEIIVSTIEKLVISALAKGTSYAAQDYFQKRRVERSVEAASSNVAETLVAFFKAERVDEDVQELLLLECRIALEPIAADPSPLFGGSLNGQIIFDQMFAEAPIPASVSEPAVRPLFEMVFVRIASVLCLVPSAVRDWEANAWKEGFRRLDTIVAEIKSVFDRVDAINTRLSGDLDSNVSTLRKYLAQREAVQIDITGLRSDHAVHKTMEEMFVHPEISRTWEDKDARYYDVAESDLDYVRAFISRGSRSIVYGAPGSGKSTWSRWLHRLGLSELWDGVVIRAELKAFDFGKAPSILGLLKAAVGINYAEIVDADLLGKLISSSKLALILDGFDEIGAARRDEALAWLQELEVFVERCPVAITSRPLATDHLQKLRKQWQKWSVEPFDVGRIVGYITKWYVTADLLPDAPTPDAQLLAEQWRGDHTIAPLTGNPLLLSTLLMVHYLEGNLPSGRAELYDRYIRGMLGGWDGRRGVEQTLKIDLETKRTILSDIAVEMIQRGVDQLDELDALEIVGAALTRLDEPETADVVLDGIRERSGLLVGPGIYSFSHKTIGEFLVAQAVVQGDRELPDGSRLDSFKLFDLRQRDEWNAVLFLWAGLAPVATVEQFIRKCGEASDGAAAFGLMLDQYHRFKAPLKAKLAGHLKPCLNTIPYDKALTYVLGGLTAKHPDFGDKTVGPLLKGSASQPNASIKTISRSQGRLRTLVDRLIDDGLLVGDDLRGLESSPRELIWMLAIRKAGSRALFRKVLGNIPFTKGQRRRRLYWVLESEIARNWALYAAPVRAMVPADLIQEIVSFDRSLIPGVPMAIMSAAVRRAFASMGSSTDQIARLGRISVESSKLLLLPGNNDLAGDYLFAT